MSSLFRIARALDVTQDWLLAAGAEATATEPVPCCAGAKVVRHR